MTDPATPAPAGRLIVGCGYLGQRVARRWLDCRDTVYATTRSADRAAALRAQGVRPLLGDVTVTTGQPAALPDLPEVETVLWCVGFDRTADASYRDVHVDGLRRLLDRLSGRPRVIFASSTGVWGETQGTLVNESTPPCPSREAGQILVEAEATLQQHLHGPGVVLRFAGLYGPDRLPRLADLKAGKPLPADPDSWLNLIHIDDAARIVCHLASLDQPQPLYVVSDGTPLRRRDWYTTLARLTGSPTPAWEPKASHSRGGDKQIDSRKVWADLGCRPAHPNALEAVGSLL
jgi:nucleoside-diphosphate-sugar epimerase